MIRDTMGMGVVIAHVTLTVSDPKPFPQCKPPDDQPGGRTPGLLYRQSTPSSAGGPIHRRQTAEARPVRSDKSRRL